MATPFDRQSDKLGFVSQFILGSLFAVASVTALAGTFISGYAVATARQLDRELSYWVSLRHESEEAKR